ncbi:hypothetical protein RD792_013007 [Penstemon davidsonii]|uniref:histidine kinase n=1 Tax=Penstemon davidsonii TaxID=160366 RepID=A0ABR0CT48_9LAMI|nr:hypothetical protein RD792_013007 [Penstemon davidsonii]
MYPCSKRSFDRDIEQEEEEIQYESTFCLTSSYYSVFVVRLAIMIMLAILIGLLTLLTWHITRVYTTRSLKTLAYGLRHELLQRPLLRMWNIVNSTVEVATAQVTLSESVIKRYNKPVNQAQQVELYEAMKDVTWAMFASRKALNSITLKYRNGFVQAFHRNHKSNNTYYIYSDLANYSISTSSSSFGVNLLSYHEGWDDQSIRSNISAIWYREPLNPITGDKIGKSNPIPPDELINIAGISQVPDGTASWHIAVSKYTDSPLLSAALPVWDPTRENIVAVVGVTTALYSVGQLMKELVEFHSGHIYLTSQEGWLLATSSNTSILMNSSSGPKLMMAVDSDDFVIRSGAKCLEEEYGNKFVPSQEVHIENAKLGKELYYIDSFFLNLKRLPMLVNFTCWYLFCDSHELRTPMAAVIGLLDILMSDDCLTSEQHAMITQMRKCSTALLRLLNNILDLSKVESGKLILDESEFDLGRELEGLIDMFSVQCINHNVETVLDLSAGYIILRVWCETIDNDGMIKRKLAGSCCANKKKWKRDREVSNGKISSKKDKKMILWFEVDDTGCGIDPSKWESVFESFEQADPSTTRLHGGTGLGLCIVRTLVNKMNGEIKVVKKNGPGTLMQLYLVLSVPDETTKQQYQLNLEHHNLTVLLALNGSMTRSIMTQWLNKNGVFTSEASEWNELTQRLQELSTTQCSETSVFIVVFDIGLLDSSTSIWKGQLDFLDKYRDRANFAWILNHDTSNSIKTELRKRGHLLMVNKPLYKAKMIQIFEAVIKERSLKTEINTIALDDLEIDSSDDSEKLSEERNVNERRRPLEGVCILLAEDTPVLQRVATIMLEKMGANVVVVGDGILAVDALKTSKNKFDLILMDCQMPKMDGYEATKAIRRSECGTGLHIPIVALTAHAMSCDEKKCLEVGMDAYLTKPIDCKLMASTILALTKERCCKNKE